MFTHPFRQNHNIQLIGGEDDSSPQNCVAIVGTLSSLWPGAPAQWKEEEPLFWAPCCCCIHILPPFS